MDGSLLYFWLSARPAIDSIPSLKIQRQFLIYEVCSLLLRFTGLITGVMIYNDSICAMILYSIINALCYFSLIMFVLWKCKNMSRKYLEPVIRDESIQFQENNNSKLANTIINNSFLEFVL